jgi:hypothetical protein
MYTYFAHTPEFYGSDAASSAGAFCNHNCSNHGWDCRRTIAHNGLALRELVRKVDLSTDSIIGSIAVGPGLISSASINQSSMTRLMKVLNTWVRTLVNGGVPG